MIRDYYELVKPGIVYGNVLTALAAFSFALHQHVHFLLLAATLIGLSCSIAGACVLNNIIDRDIDVRMERTKDRPLVTGRISARHAAWYAACLLLLGFGTLTLYTNVYALGMTAFGVLAYLLLYTPAKRTTQHSTLIGSFAGAVPPVVGYAAAAHVIDAAAVLLFLILVCWQMTHFFAIAIFRKKEYAHAKLPIMSVRAGVWRTKTLMFVYAILFAYASLLLGYVHHTSILYTSTMAVLSGIWILLSLYGFWSTDERRWARTLFFYSIAVIILFSAVLAFS